MNRWASAVLLVSIASGCADSGMSRAAAGTWIVLNTSANGDTVEVNAASVLRNGNVATYQGRETFVPPRPVFSGQEIAAIIDTFSVKCDERTAAKLGGEAVSVTGVHLPMPVSAPTYNVVPDDARTPAAQEFNYVCGAS